MLERLAIDRGAILFDPERVAIPGGLLFDPAHWHAQGALTEQSGGRGSIQFIDNEDRRWVMRRYLRGGMAARFARDRYLWLGEERTRSFRELRLLATLRERGLPVPAPIAARYRRGFLTYGAELITERLDGRPTAVRDAGGRPDGRRALGRDRALPSPLPRRRRAARRPQRAATSCWASIARSGCSTSTAAGSAQPGSWRERVLDRLARSLAKISGDAGDWKVGFALLRLAHDA